MENLTWCHNEKLNTYKSTINSLIWDQNFEVSLFCSKISAKNELLEAENQILKIINKINNGRDKIIDTIIKDGNFELAKDWLSPLKKVKNEGILCFQNEAGEFIPCELTKEEFASYIEINMLEIKYTKDELIADIVMHTTPDCFSGHYIEIFIIKDCLTGRYKISPNGLVG